jgi:hypothetical protein
MAVAEDKTRVDAAVKRLATLFDAGGVKKKKKFENS